MWGAAAAILAGAVGLAYIEHKLQQLKKAQSGTPSQPEPPKKLSAPISPSKFAAQLLKKAVKK